MGDRPQKVVFIGSANVGKTALMTRIVDGHFDPNTEPTACATYAPYALPGDDPIQIQFWDTAGMERYKSINKIYYHDAVVALLTFDLTLQKSFEDVSLWKKEFERGKTQESAKCILVGNKCDLVDNCEVTEEAARIWASEQEMLYFPVSAVTGEGVSELLDGIIGAMPSRANEAVVQMAGEVPKQGGDCC